MSSVPNSPLPDDILSAPPGSTAAHDRLLFVGFDDWQIAHQRLCWIAGTGEEERLFRKCLPALLQVLCDSAAPDQVLMYLERLASAVPDRAEFFRMFLERPRGWEILGRLFAGSQFLSEILLSNPAYLDPLTRQRTLSEIKGVEQFHQEARSSLAECATEAERWDALRRHQRWELLRIGVCDFFGLLDLRRVTVQLSLLADGLIASALDLAANTRGPTGSVRTRPAPRSNAAGSSWWPSKVGRGGTQLQLGHRPVVPVERGTSGPHADRSTADQNPDVGDRHGFLYRVDMRLRPWGRAGELVPTLGAYVEYLEQQARIWEKQALLKARVVAGDRAVGATFLRQVGERIFGESPADVRDEIRRMKERIEGDLRKQGKDWGEIKLGRGSIRDVEFAAQSLQLVHGGRLPDARSFNTLDALVRLTDLGFLQADEYRMLSDAYVFLRTVEHALQLRHNKQTHELPRDPAELMSLARRLDFGSDTQFLDHYRRHRDATRRVFDRCLGNSEPQRPELEPPLAMPRGPARTTAETPGRGPRSARTQRHLSRLAATYEQAFPPADIDRHAALAESLSPDVSVLVEAKPRGDGAWTLTIVGYDFHGALSLIAGLLLAHGCNVIDGQVFTYDPAAEGDVVSAPPLPPRDVRPAPSEQRSMHVRKQSRRETPHVEGETRVDRGRRIVDVFTVRPTFAEAGPENWKRYEEELRALSDLAAQGRVDEAHGRLVKRVAATLRAAPVPRNRPSTPSRSRSTTNCRTVLPCSSSGGGHAGVPLRIDFGPRAGGGIDQPIAGRVRAGRRLRHHPCDRPARPQDRRHRPPPRTAGDDRAHQAFHPPVATIARPEGALVRFRDFLARLFQRPNWPDEVADLERPEVLRALARLLGVSDFLWNDFLRMQHENLFPLVRDVDALATRKSPIQLEAELRDWLAAAGPQWRGALSDYRDREMFRVDMRQILGHTEDFVRFSEELTDVADATVRAALGRCHAETGRAIRKARVGGGGAVPTGRVRVGKMWWSGNGFRVGHRTDVSVRGTRQDGP